MLHKPVSQSCAVAKRESFWRATGQSLWPVEQSFILSARFDCPVARQNCSLTAYDCETGLLSFANVSSMSLTNAAFFRADGFPLCSHPAFAIDEFVNRSKSIPIQINETGFCDFTSKK